MLIGEYLRELGKLLGYRLIYALAKSVQEFEKFFKLVTGHTLWPAQKLWARRLLQGDSFAIVAPTGVGKTTLLEVYALWLAGKGGRVYYVVPTRNLVKQVASKLRLYASQISRDITIYAYDSLSKSQKESLLKSIEEKTYDILVTTSNFMLRYFNILARSEPDLLIVDDVDAVLRSPKTVSKTLTILGFSDKAIELALKAVRLRIDAHVAKVKGREKLAETLYEKLASIEVELADEISSSKPGQLVIASATGRAYGIHGKIFNKLLGFEVGRITDTLRNIVNTYLYVNDVNAALNAISNLVSRLKGGGIIFVSKLYKEDIVDSLAERIEEIGLRTAISINSSKTTKLLQEFAKGEIDVLIGKATYYGTLVRGIDLPERLYYTIFLGTPVHIQSIDKALMNPRRLVEALTSLALEKDLTTEVLRLVSKLTPTEVSILRKLLNDNSECKEGNRICRALELLNQAYEEVLEAIRVATKPLKLADGVIIERNGQIIYLTPDAATYVQASGRTSRLYHGSMTYGISIVVEEFSDLIELLQRKLARFLGLEKLTFKHLSEIDINEEVRKARTSRTSSAYRRPLRIETCCIIVESPTKARTLAHFFGKPAKRRIGPLLTYEISFYNPRNNTMYIASITATQGHIFDLTVDNIGVYGVKLTNSTISPVYASIKKCMECGRQFASSKTICPYCGSTNVADKQALIEALRRLALETGNVYIATDPDIEGEKIAWDIYLSVKPYAEKIYRIELHEITVAELFKALAKPRQLDRRLVEAQILRRIEDRWIGFALSKYLQESYDKPWLGAGRVQTPVLGWIIERYEEWKASRKYAVRITLTPLTKITIYCDTRDEAKTIATYALEGIRLHIDRITEVEVKPLPPYTTDTLIYDASRLLGLTAEKTMKIAQDLFETGLITYHRTDSMYVSSQGIIIAKECLERYGLDYMFSSKHWGKPGTHEAIRPTRPLDVDSVRRAIATGEIYASTRLTELHYKLYALIFGRFIMSQVKPFKAKKAELSITIKDYEHKFEAYIDVEEPKLLSLYPIIVIDKELSRLIDREVKPLDVRIYRASAIKLYTHGDVVMKMKQMGIGRPSTYSRTIDVLKRHGYIVESKRRKYLIPTKLGRTVYRELMLSYPDLVSVARTRQLYDKMKLVEEGKQAAATIVLELYRELIGNNLLKVDRSMAVEEDSVFEA